MTGLQPFDPWAVALIGALNPVAIAAALYLGRLANEPQKILVAAFAAALLGSAFVWLATFLGLLPAKGIGGEAGVFVVQFLLGLIWAWLGYKSQKAF